MPSPPSWCVHRTRCNRFIYAPNDLGLGRAYVAGDLDVEGDLFRALYAFARIDVQLDRALLTDLVKALGPSGLKPLPPPPEEARMHGSRHSRARDAAAVSYHYDLSNEFYRLMLGPSMTYSCAVWENPGVGLEAAQAAKLELICQKLALKPGMRLLDVGCGWGSMALHAAERHGVEVVGVTVSSRQVEAAQRAGEGGWSGRAGGHPPAGLPRRGRRPLRRHQLDRDVRARRSQAAGRLLRPPARAAASRGPVAQPRHLPAARLPRRAPRHRAEVAVGAADVHRPLRLPRRGAPRARAP